MGLTRGFFLTATVIVSFTLIGLVDATGIIVAVFIDHLNASNAKGGWIGSITFFIALALSPVVVYIHRQFGFRWCMLISCVFYGFSVSVTPFITNINLVFLTYSIPLGTAISFLVTLSIITQQEYFRKYFGFAVGVRFSANSLGAMAISFTLPICFVELGYKVTFLTLLIFAPVILCYGFVARHRTIKEKDTKRSKESVIDVYKEVLQDRSFTICLVGSAVYYFTCIIPMVFMVRYGITLGYSLSKAKWLMVMRQLTTFLSRLVSGRCGDIALRHGKVKMLLQITFVLFGVLNCICSFVRSFSLLLVYMALIGIVDGVWWVTHSLLIMEITGGYYFNEAFSLLCLVGAFAILFGPPAAGWIFDQTNDFRYVFYTVFGTSLLAALLLTISACVRVDKEYSLVEKSKHKIEVVSCEFVADRTHLSENVAEWAYETTV